jgi:hypothetical protein
VASQEGFSSINDLVQNEMTGSDIDDELQTCGENIITVPFIVISLGCELRDNSTANIHHGQPSPGSGFFG